MGTATASASYSGDTNHSAEHRLGDLQHRAGDGNADDHDGELPGERSLYGQRGDPVHGDGNGRRHGGLNQSLTVTYTNNINPGTAGASASFAGNATYSASTARQLSPSLWRRDADNDGGDLQPDERSLIPARRRHRARRR